MGGVSDRDVVTYISSAVELIEEYFEVGEICALEEEPCRIDSISMA
jgi:hypothetical protein